MRIVFEGDNLAAAARDRLFECRFDNRAVGVVGDQGCKRAFPGGDRVVDDALYVGLRQKAQEIDAVRSHIGVGRKGDDRDIARPRQLPDHADRLREQRPKDDLGTLVQSLLGALPRRLGGAAVIFHQELNIGRIELGDRHFGRVAHRLTGNAGIAARGQRQNERCLDLA